MDVSIMQHKTRGFWGLFIIDHTKPGTHEHYNVVYNNQCNGIEFETFADAAERATEILKDYENTK